MIDWSGLVLAPCMDAFGGPVTYQPAAGVSVVITGVFDEAYLDQDPSQTLLPDNVTNARPALGVQLSQFPQPPLQGDLVTIQSTGATFSVVEVQPDSHGGAFLLLTQVAA